jgi:DNA processing protein
MALEHWLQLSFTEGVGPILIQRLIEHFGSAEAACNAGKELAQIEGIGTVKASAISRSLAAAKEKAAKELQQATAKGITILSPDDSDYPTLLKSIPSPPTVLYIRGDLQPRDLNAVAIVGSRKCSLYGREQADRFGALLASAGFTVVSGGARGIDSAAHRGALSHPQGRTLVVLGCGVDIVYPPENKELFAQISNGRGAIISEFPLDTPPLADNFPRRNRIISGLSRGVLVTEAAERSGALITARRACDDHGRPVFAIPGRIDNLLSVGPHQLLRDGAILTTSMQDIINELGPLPHHAMEGNEPSQTEPEPPTEQRAPIELTVPQSKILACLDKDPMIVDQIILQTSLPAQAVLQEMTMLTLKGLVRRVDGQSFVRN